MSEGKREKGKARSRPRKSRPAPEAAPASQAETAPEAATAQPAETAPEAATAREPATAPETATVAQPTETVAASEGTYAAVPEVPDPPSYAPIFTGLGISVSAWGLLTSPAISALGLVIFIFGMLIWIKELTTHEP